MTKPDFEKLAEESLGAFTTYGRRDAEIGSAARNYYETELKGWVAGCDHVWTTIVEPLQRQLDHEKGCREKDSKLYEEAYQGLKSRLRAEVEKRIAEMEQALKELPNNQHERVKGNLATCDWMIRTIDKF